nr:PREDICTED: uncharacterized protein LOC109029679 [Bemisia tabaci]
MDTRENPPEDAVKLPMEPTRDFFQPPQAECKKTTGQHTIVVDPISFDSDEPELTDPQPKKSRQASSSSTDDSGCTPFRRGLCTTDVTSPSSDNETQDGSRKSSGSSASSLSDSFLTMENIECRMKRDSKYRFILEFLKHINLVRTDLQPKLTFRSIERKEHFIFRISRPASVALRNVTLKFIDINMQFI